MSDIRLFFVLTQPAGTSQKERELQVARARSHAARSVQRQRRLQNSVNTYLSQQKSTKSPVKNGSPPDSDVAGGNDTDKGPTGNVEPSTAVALQKSLSLIKPSDEAPSIKIFWQIAVPNLDTWFDSFSTNNRNFIEYYLDLMKHDVFFHAAAADMHGIRDALNDPEWHESPSPAVLSHRGKALSALRKSLQDAETATNDEVIMSILWLSILDHRTNDTKAHSIHTRYLRRLVRQRGGLEKIGGLLSFNLSQFEAFWRDGPGEQKGLDTQPPQATGPGLPVVRISTTSLGPSLNRLPTGFRNIARSGKLSQELIEVLCQVTDVWRSLDDIRIGQPSAASNGIIRIVHQAYTISSSAKAVKGDDASVNLERLLYLGLLCFCSIFICPMSKGMQIFWAFRTELTTLLVQAVEPESDVDQDCLFWIWAITVLSWTAEAPRRLTRKGIKLRDQMKDKWPWISHNCGKERVLAVLSKFLWNQMLECRVQELIFAGLTKTVRTGTKQLV